MKKASKLTRVIMMLAAFFVQTAEVAYGVDTNGAVNINWTLSAGTYFGDINGEYTSLLGPTGSGKSTIAQLMYSPDAIKDSIFPSGTGTVNDVVLDTITITENGDGGSEFGLFSTNTVRAWTNGYVYALIFQDDNVQPGDWYLSGPLVALEKIFEGMDPQIIDINTDSLFGDAIDGPNGAQVVEGIVLTVHNGSGSGMYTNGHRVAISANTPAAGQTFDKWVGATQYVNNVTYTNALVTLATTNPVILTATYKNLPGYYTLTVSNGSGGGAYTNQQRIAIAADAPAAGKVFDRWIGDTQVVNNVTYTNALVTMPANAVSLTATYKDIYYTLTVTNGSGGGSYTNQHQITITANAPAVGKTFVQWIGDTQYLSSATSATATVTMPAASMAVTATYADLHYALTVTGGSGSGSYTNAHQVAIAANAPAAGKAFDRWIGDTQYLASAASVASNTVIMPTNPVTLTATYVDVYYALTITSGSGSGSYTNGHRVAISADAPAAGAEFYRWTGDTQYVNNVTYSNALVTMPARAVSLTATYQAPMISYRTNTIAEISGGAITGKYEAAETINITVFSTNNGPVAVSNIAHTLYADPACFTITPISNVANYAFMPVGASTSTTYRVAIHTNAPNGTYLFSVTNQAGTTSWTGSFPLTVSSQGIPSNTPSAITINVLPGAVATNTQVTVTNKGSAEFTFSITDNGAWITPYTAVQGGGGWVTANSPVVLNDPDTNNVYIEAATEGVSSAAGIGFGFPFYGTTYSNFYVTADGCIGLLNTTNVPAQSASGIPFPVTNSMALFAPFRGVPLIAPFWGNLTSPAGSIKTIRSDNNYLVISYSGVSKDSGLTNLQFQTALYTDGRIEFRYKTITGVTNIYGLTNVTIGIQGDAGSYTNLSLVPVNGTSVLLTPQQPDQWVRYSPAQGSVAPRSSQVITFIADASGKTSATSTSFKAQFNWSTGGSNVVTVSVNVTSAPVYSAVSSLSFTGAAGQVTYTNFVIYNTNGTAPLTFTINNSVAATAGYIVTNPPYSWIDLATNTVPLSDPDSSPYITAADEGSSGMIPLRFAFPFYGSSYTQLSVSVNGAVRLDTTNRVLTLVNLASTSRMMPAKMIAPYWDDLVLDANSTLKYASATNRFVITWENVSQYGINGGSNQTFQAVLTPDGVITFQYKKLEGQSWANTTIGLRDATNRTVRTDIRTANDLMITTNQYGMAVTQYVGAVSNRTAQFLPAQIQVIRYTPAGGSIPAGSNAVITIIGDASNQTPAGTNSLVTNATLAIANNTGVAKTLAVTFKATNSLENVFVRASALADGSIDSDGDGIPDDQERIAGTDPQNADSVFSPVIGRDSSGAFLSWPAPLDGVQRTYTVYFSTNLMGGWNYLGTVTNGTSYSDTAHSSAPVIYYKVTVPVQ